MTDVSTIRLWARRILGVAAILFLLFDGVTKLTDGAFVTEAASRLGGADSAIPILSVLPLVLTIFYALPRSAPPGAVLITAFLGAAIAARLLFGDMLVELTAFPVYGAGFICGGLLLREPRIAQLFQSVRAEDPVVAAPRAEIVAEHTDGDVDRAFADVCFIDPEPTTNDADDAPFDRMAS
jgi:hypothetical protein